MLVTVDPVLCEANAVCVFEAPDVFELADDDALRILLPQPLPEHEAAVRDAVTMCPKQALRIVESDPEGTGGHQHAS